MIHRTQLASDHEISRIIRGGWQMAGGHGDVSPAEAVLDMMAFAEAGITTFDCADIYTGVEEMIGAFRLRYGAEYGTSALDRIKIHTKFVPDLDILPRITKADVERIIDRSLHRLRAEALDLVQFHWWDYDAPRWLDTVHWLDELRRAGKIRHLGGTNFDTSHMLAIVNGGVPLVSMQVQYSLLDRRPENAMVEAAAKHGVALLCYGTVAGGFLSDRWLDQPEPQAPLENRSLVKYKLIIDDFGGWDLFQALLSVLRRLADRRNSDIATVASAAMLAKPGVAAVIVGARNRSHLADNLQITEIVLTADETSEIDKVLAAAIPIAGDVYALERDRSGRHGSIMKYNLSTGTA
ncbi:aldo/keto reductase [Acidisoma sp.]|uniref:aldo/keto reductase n=1 Tax=Acidisoma sp. TaxID=1872115 RepID=UPI003B009736